MRVPATTPANSNKTRLDPDCENGKNDNAATFLECINKFAMVHSLCNKLISKVPKHNC